MIRSLFALAATVALLAAPAVAEAAPHGGSGVVSAWKVGELRFGVATESDVIAFAGEPERRLDDDNDYTGEDGVVLGYDCATSGRCVTEYAINRTRDELVNFGTRSKHFRTPNGTEVGQSRRRAVRQERRKVKSGCLGYTITRKRGDRLLSVTVNRRWVTYISSYGPGGGPYFSC